MLFWGRCHIQMKGRSFHFTFTEATVSMKGWGWPRVNLSCFLDTLNFFFQYIRLPFRDPDVEPDEGIPVATRRKSDQRDESLGDVEIYDRE